MIDLSYKKPEHKKDSDDFESLIASIGFVAFSVFLTIVCLSSIVGEPLF